MSKRPILQGLLAILLSVVLAACGGDGDDPAPTQVSSSPPAPATAPTVAAPVQSLSRWRKGRSHCQRGYRRQWGIRIQSIGVHFQAG